MIDSVVHAAQYLRMSTDQQRYSLDNQADAIAKYAKTRGFVVVKTYSDAAKSGLRLKNRAGLKQLLQDVVQHNGEFRAVLVYDVSRWGRFQDTDEAAHYEYLCKSSGVPVHYCAEMFANDNTTPGLIMKALKRSMAGEYSRELSGKVRAGLTRLIRMGYRPGGPGIYGMRRLLLDASGRPKQLLTRGERKNLVSEHVILVPGAAEEIAIVKRVFHEWSNEYRSLRAIAERLNHDGVSYRTGVPWDANDIRRMLKNHNYAGRQVWGRTKCYLGGKAEMLPAEEWVRCDNAFEPIIGPDLFEKTQARFANLTCNLSDDEMLERLRMLLQLEGRLNTQIIERSQSCPSLTTYHSRFGGLLSAYRRIGYPEPKFASAEAARQISSRIRDELIEALVAHSNAQLEIVRPGIKFRALLRYHRTGLLISVLLARYRASCKGEARWLVVPHEKEYQRMTVLVLLDEANSAIKQMWLLPRVGPHRFALRENGKALSKAVAFSHPSELLGAIRKARSLMGRPVMVDPVTS
jgi:DNA invertase Pin-like site-specific DNA recombinase